MRKRYTPAEDEPAGNDNITENVPDVLCPEKKKPSFVRSQILTITRIVLCALILGFAFAARTVGGEFYAVTASWFFDRYNSSLFTGGENENNAFLEEASITETVPALPYSNSRPDGSVSSDGEAHAGGIGITSENAAAPLKSGKITSAYGTREYSGEEQIHKGVDIAADKNSEIMAVFDGEVTVAQNDPTYGNYIVLLHGDGSKTLYAHCEKLLVSKGDIVKAGSVIALVGSTGDSTGSHLHLELIIDGENADPAMILGDRYK